MHEHFSTLRLKLIPPFADSRDNFLEPLLCHAASNGCREASDLLFKGRQFVLAY